jgi:cell division protein ZapA (FtsZ GTPase activity inhibitor)
MLSGKKYTVQIGGETYVVVSAESPAKVESSVASVDTLMREISDSTVSTSLKKAAILAALKLSLEVQSLKEELDQTQQAVQKLITQLETI